MANLLWMVLFPMLHHFASSSPDAGSCLEEIERNILYSAFDKKWVYIKHNFTLSVNQAKNSTDLNVLLHQLRVLESHVYISNQTVGWRQWKRKYWRVITNPDLDLQKTESRFIIALMEFECNILPEALNTRWREQRRTKWLSECSSLVDSLHKLSFYDEVYQNVDTLLKVFGYNSLEEYNNKAIMVVKAINSAAASLERATKVSGIAETTAGTAGIVSGILAAVGIILAPVSAGASLALTGTGMALGVGSAASKYFSLLNQMTVDRLHVKEVSKLTNAILAETMAITHVLENYECAANEVTTELGRIKTFEFIKYLSGPVVWHFKSYFGMKKAVKAYRMWHIIRELGAKNVPKAMATKRAFEVAAPEVKIPGRIRKLSPKIPKFLLHSGTTLASTAAKLNGFLSAMSVGFGIWDIISGTKKIQKGSDLTKEIRALAKNIAEANRMILLAYDIDPELAFTQKLIGTVHDTEGNAIEWHMACFLGDQCLYLAMPSQNATAVQGDRLCRRHGKHLLAVGKRHVSDIVRKWLKLLGKSAWFSTSSTFIDFAPGTFYFRRRGCLFFSETKSFKVEIARCKSVKKPAVICADN